MPTLYYVHDPMCSWCYAFAPTWQRIKAGLPASISTRYVLGGLAPDTDLPMPAEIRNYIQRTWRQIEASVPGTEFNYAFWSRCKPRRATYPACRAVLAAKHQGSEHEEAMLGRIQAAYYREARNPAELDTLCELAGELGLDVRAFRGCLVGAACEARLEADLRLTRALGVGGFPSLVLETATGFVRVPHDYLDPGVTLAALAAARAPRADRSDQ